MHQTHTRSSKCRNNVLSRVVKQNVSADDVSSYVAVVRLGDVFVDIFVASIASVGLGHVLAVVPRVVDGRGRDQTDPKSDRFALASQNLKKIR